MADSGRILNRGDMIQLLRTVDDELAAIRKNKNERFNLILVGGAAMVMHNLRGMSADLDGLWRARRLQKAFDNVAIKYKLRSAWINQDFKKTNSYTEAIYDNCHKALSFNCLDIYLVNDDLLLCMKLISGRVRQDKNDIKDAAAIVNKLKDKEIIITQRFLNELLEKYYDKYNRGAEITSQASLDFIAQFPID